MPYSHITPEVKQLSQLNIQKGLEALQSGDSNTANLYFLEAHKLNQNNFDALNFLGIIAYQKREYSKALSYLHGAYMLNNRSIQALNNLGLCYVAISEYQEALKYFDIAIKIDAEIPDIHNNRGNALRGLNNNSAALHAYERALSLRPTYVQAINNMGVILLEENKLQKAIVFFKKATSLNPKFPEALNNLGNAYTALGQYEDAFACYEAALKINPQYIDALHNLGNSLKKNGKNQAAIDCYEHSIQLHPEYAKSYCLLADIYYDLGNNGLAIEKYLLSLKLDPTNIETRFSLLIAQIPKLLMTNDELTSSRKSFLEQIADLEDACNHNKYPLDPFRLISKHPFYIAYHEENNVSLLSKFGLICNIQAAPIQSSLINSKIHPQYSKIRIGIVSHYFNNHPVWHAITKGLVLNLDPQLFEIFLLNTNGVEDAETEFAKSKVAHYINLGSSLMYSAKCIQDFGLDILLFPEIGMDTLTKSLACLRLAPLQIASWGHPETTGLPTIDLFLSAVLFEKEGASSHYSETLLQLPSLGTFIEEDHTRAVKPNLESFNINIDAPIILCAGSPSKYSPLDDHVLVEIAKKLKHCNFIFFNFQENLSSQLRERLNRVFFAAGLNGDDYFKFIPFLPKQEFFGLLLQADIYLDTIGFSGFNTALQAIFCNLPVVTIEGKFMRGRLASGILNHIGLHELVCNTKEEYVNLAIEILNNKAFANQIKNQISRSKSSLFSDSSPIDALEDYLIEHIKKYDASGINKTDMLNL